MNINNLCHLDVRFHAFINNHSTWQKSIKLPTILLIDSDNIFLIIHIAIPKDLP